MNTLTTSTFFGNTSPTPAIPPAPSIQFPDPISYEFQVLEYVEDSKIKVTLQIRKHTHDQYGNIKIFGTWQDVPRVQVTL